MTFWIILAVLVIGWLVYRRLQMRNLNISPEELSERLRKVPKPILLDVRTQQEYNSGHIHNARNLPVQQLRRKLNSMDKYKRNEVVVYCQTGNRSAAVARLLNRMDFDVKHLKGGIVAYNRYQNSSE